MRVIYNGEPYEAMSRNETIAVIKDKHSVKVVSTRDLREEDTGASTRKKSAKP